MSRVPASPYFFRPVKRALLAGVAVLCLLAHWLPAPLGVAADPGAPPNPARSAWFLLWVQELVSHDTRLIWIALLLGVALFALPWISGGPVDGAAWFRRDRWLVSLAASLALIALVVLTVVGLFFRGIDWALVSPF